MASGNVLDLAGTGTHVVIDEARGPVDGPPVVLSAGLAGNWFDWDPLTALLTVRRTVIRVDRPGYGRSEPLPAGALPTLATEVTRLAELLDALDLRRAVMVGHSMASFYVEAFAREYPQRTAALVLLDGSVEDSPRRLLPARLRDGLLERTADAATALGVQRLGPVLHRMIGGGDAHEYAEILSSPQFLRAAVLENGRYSELARRLAELRERAPMPSGVPVTVAAGHPGRPTPTALSWLREQRGLADLLGAWFAVITPSGHQVMVDQPAQCAALILDAARD
ncbi:alpha/beta hydrolase [Tsukamurella serpentis]